MTDPSTKAREICKTMADTWDIIDEPRQHLYDLIAAALREYGEEEFKRGCELFADGGYSHGNKEGYQRGFSEGRLEGRKDVKSECDDAYKWGFSDCREKSIKIVDAEEELEGPIPTKKNILQKIRALRAEGEKG